jgi:aerobic carbon-monoxide dehydrogenase medium subunit
MTPFALKRPTSIADATAAFSGDAAWLAGGHTLIPAMKSRLRSVETLVDLSAIPGLADVRVDADRLVIGAMATHAAVATSPVVKAAIPGLAALAALIGDPQVRNFGTIGGSIANNDPAADYPAALVALDAIVETTHGHHAAEDFFQGMFTTALGEGELVTAVSFRVPTASVYAKHRHPASRYAIAGVYVARFDDGVRVAVTGATTAVTRWPAAEAAIAQGAALPATLESDDLATDIHASAEFRAHLAGVMLRQAAAKP